MPGTRNPAWQRDELILALDLYFRCNPSHTNANNEEVIVLSKILNALPIHTDRPDAERYRNPNGVYMKLCNFLRFDPNYKGDGLQRGGKLEKEIWNEFAGDRVHLRKVAHNIIDGIKEKPNHSAGNLDDDEDGFPEGKVLYRIHKARERNRALVSKAKELAAKKDTLKCTVCGFDFYKVYGELGKGYIECHHNIPVSEYDSNKKTSVKDLVLVCSNCHRMLHRRRPWLHINQLSDMLRH